jgi:hypothetical protein
MIIYQKDGKEYLLLANSKHGLLKIPTEGIDKVEAIEKPVGQGKTAGQKAEKVEAYKDVKRIDKYGKELVAMLMGDSGSMNLEVVELP